MFLVCENCKNVYEYYKAFYEKRKYCDTCRDIVKKRKTLERKALKLKEKENGGNQNGL